jgi:hypothetical protein
VIRKCLFRHSVRGATGHSMTQVSLNRYKVAIAPSVSPPHDESRFPAQRLGEPTPAYRVAANGATGCLGVVLLLGIRPQDEGDRTE